MIFNRSDNAKKNISSGLIVKIVTILFPFIMRTIVINTLGNIYLGLGSLFSSILNTLSLAELGIGNALVFSMYKPVAENDKKQICALLNVYKKAYYIIGFFILFIGLALLPFLPELVGGKYPKEINLYLLYIIHLCSIVIGYFFYAYRGSVLIAYQRGDITNVVTFITDLIMYFLQIVALVCFKNYYLYILLMVIKNVVFNIIIDKIVKERYPELRAVGDIGKEVKKSIFKKTSALTGHRIAEVVINSTDNILISMFMGLNMVAIYNNYFYVVTALSGILLMIFTALIPIVGNYLIMEEINKISRLFDILNYFNAFVVAICSACLINMYQPFISIWTGKENIFPMKIVVLFILYFYTLRIRAVLSLFQNAAGIWEKDLKKAYAMTIINLIIDISLIGIIGVSAALISSIISMVFAFIYEAIVVNKYILRRKVVHFLFINSWYFLCTLVSCILSFLIFSFINEKYNFVSLFIGGFIAMMVSCICFMVLTSWSGEFKYSLEFLRCNIKK